MAAALDAAIRMSERGGLGALLPELARIAVMAGVLPCAAAQGEVDRDALVVAGDREGGVVGAVEAASGRGERE